MTRACLSPRGAIYRDHGMVTKGVHVMCHVGVREFRDRATTYLSGDEVLSVEKHGKPIGYYPPAPSASEEKIREDVERLAAAVKRALDETGMTEDELADLFDLNKSF